MPEIHVISILISKHAIFSRNTPGCTELERLGLKAGRKRLLYVYIDSQAARASRIKMAAPKGRHFFVSRPRFQFVKTGAFAQTARRSNAHRPGRSCL
jgi:hypothetical protein